MELCVPLQIAYKQHNNNNRRITKEYHDIIKAPLCSPLGNSTDTRKDDIP